MRSARDFAKKPAFYHPSPPRRGRVALGRHSEKKRIMTSQDKPGIVFAHGVWLDGSYFNKVIPALQADGHQG
jgi:hypothetical protein